MALNKNLKMENLNKNLNGKSKKNYSRENVE